MDTRFHCVYLLTSLDPQCEGAYYIGYTVNPLRRLRQHNGELVSGAQRTKRRGRPWTLVCCVSGFAEDRAALKFEWCWQHPSEAARLKHAAPALRSLRRLPRAVATLHHLIHADLFCRLSLTLHVFDEARFTSAAAAANGAGPPTALLPPLPQSSLFSVESVSPEVFEQRYLRHERQQAGDGDGITPVSLPFDASALSQTAADAWARDTSEDARGAPPALPAPASWSPASPGRSSLRAGMMGGPDTTGTRHRVPLRYAYYTEKDFTRAYLSEAEQAERGELPCSLCALPLSPMYVLRCPQYPLCGLRTHLTCLALWMLHDASLASSRGADGAEDGAEVAEPSRGGQLLIPTRSCPCPLCATPLQWAVLVRELRHRAVAETRRHACRRRQHLEERWQARLADLSRDSAAASKRRRRRRCVEVAVRGSTNLSRRSISLPKSSDDVTAGRVTAEHGGVAAGVSPAAPVAEQRGAASPLLSVTDFIEDEWLSF